ncbi:MAG TPA: hypothetical protein VFX67_00230 [Burkholderiales bacterium]|nr:hypothetical protein [Burkholderiales bacterium]
MLRALFLTLAMAATLGAQAQVRSIPEAAKRAQMRHLQDTRVELGGKEMRLSAGAQVRDTANRIVQPSAVPERSLVKYTLDATGMVHRVWILTQHEAAQKDKEP